MSDDHLDKETSVSVDAGGLKGSANAKSRALASIDRLGGALVDVASAHLEGIAQRRRAKNAGDVKLIEATAEYLVEALGEDPAFAERAARTHYRKIAATQKNIDGVLLEAQTELEENPPTEDVEGDISEDFFSRFEKFAETASTDDMRALFGRILAGEVRRPGSIPTATMNLCASLDAKTAALVESACSIRINERNILKAAAEKQFSYGELMSLRDVGFISDLPFGNTWTMQPGESGFALTGLGSFAIAVKFSEPTTTVLDVFPITPAGVGLASCLTIKPNYEQIVSSLKDTRALEVMFGVLERTETGHVGRNMHVVYRRG